MFYDKLMLSRRALAKSLLSTFGMFLLLGGCAWSPFATGKDKDTTDGGTADAAPEREHCTHKLSACRNSCYKASAGSKCTDCCARNSVSCDEGGSYSFYSCPDEE